MATSVKQEDFQKTALRLPKELHAQLHEAASQAGRSYNAEIIKRLELSFNLEPLKDAKRDELVKLVNDAIDERMEIEKEKARLALEAPRLGLKRKPLPK